MFYRNVKALFRLVMQFNQYLFCVWLVYFLCVIREFKLWKINLNLNPVLHLAYMCMWCLMCLDKWFGIVLQNGNHSFSKMIFQKWFFKIDSIKQAPIALPRYPCPYRFTVSKMKMVLLFRLNGFHFY